MANLKDALVVLYKKVFGTLSAAPDVNKEDVGMKRATSIQDVWMLSFGISEDMWPVDLYLDEGKLIVLGNSKGKLFRIEVSDVDGNVSFGQPQEVEMKFVSKDSSGIEENRMLVKRQADGSYRWFARACSSVINKAGVIDSTRMFDKFVERFNGGKDFKLLFFHDPSLEMGIGDFVERDGNILILSGTLNDSKLSKAFIDAQEESRGNWGTSIGFLPLAEPVTLDVGDGIKIPVYEDGELHEASVLPEEDACSFFTRVGVVDEVKRMDKRVEEALRKLFGEGHENEADAFVAEIDDTNRTISDERLLTLSTPEDGEANTSETTEETPDESNKPEDNNAEEDDVFAEFNKRLDELKARVDEILTQLNATLGMKEAISADIGEIIDRELEPVKKAVAKLEKTDEEKRRQWEDDLPSRRNTPEATYRPSENRRSQDDDTPASYDELAKESLSRLKK